MPRFFLEAVAGDRATITGEDAKHIAKVLRMQPGEQLTLCDTKGTDFIGRILAADTHEVSVEILERRPSAAEPSVQITLYQAVPTGDKLETIVQKAVELGVSRIVPVLTHRCVSRPDAKTMEKKLLRYRRVALEASKQSGRGVVPEVGAMLPFAQALQEVADAPLKILFYEEATRPLGEMLADAPKQIAIFIGPEGGFETDEVKAAKAAGLQIATLGKRILRCETAPLAAISALLFATGNMD